MPCYSPLRGVMSQTPQGRRIVFKHTSRGQAMSLPCGRCIGCRLERARQWAVRLMHESDLHDASCFLTLTYDPEHLPANGSLSVEHCQLFLKRLRARVAPARVRFFLCGEYGEKLSRPHYHVILFGYDFSADRVPLKSDGEFALYTSDELTETWGLGHCSIGNVSFDSAGYVARYSLKKVVGKNAKDHYGDRRSEFCLMSRRPGIGHGWISKFYDDVYPSDEVIVKGREARPPRYYDKYSKDRDPVLMEGILGKRVEVAEKLEDFKLPSGDVVGVAPTRNYRRLAVRKRVAEARLQLKSRSSEVVNA